MTINLDLPADFEAALREAAQQANLEPDVYILQTLREHLQHVQQQPPHLPKAEADLLQQINLGLSAETWQRYHALVAKRRAKTLTDEEQQALIALSDHLEAANARRMAALVELARLRQTSLAQVMKDLGIQPPPYV